MKSLKAKFRKTDSNEWSKNDERLLSAVEHGEAEKVTTLLAKKGASPTKLDSEGKSALHVAAIRGQAECLAIILSHGADVSLADASGSSALHLAAKNNHQDCAKKLLQSKCVVDAPDSGGRTALHHAAANGNIVIVQLLCEHKSPVNVKDMDGCTPLLISARHAHTDVCGILLDWGANIDACDGNGRSAVMLASESSCVACVDLLVHRGADLHLIDSLGHDVLHYAKLSGSAEVRAVITAALQRHLAESDKSSPRSQQQEHTARPNDERSTTPKKRKAPPPPISPLQLDVFSPPYLTPNETPVSSRFNYKEVDLRSVSLLREELEKLQEEKSMLLETIADLKQITEQTEPKTGHSGSLFAALQAKVASLSLENQQLAQIIKKRPPPQGEEGQENSRPTSINSIASFHSTRAEFDLSSELSEASDARKPALHEDEIAPLRDELHSLQAELEKSRLENRSLQARLESQTGESRTDFTAKLADLQQKYQEVVLELESVRKERVRVAPLGSPSQDDEIVQKFQLLKGCLEQEVKDLKAKLATSQEDKMHDARLIKDLEARLESERRHVVKDEHQELKSSYGLLVENISQEKALLIGKYKEAQDEVKLLQEALRGTVSVEAAAKDFDEMKGELCGVIDGLQKRLLELSKSYSEAKNELAEARNRLRDKASESEQLSQAACLSNEQHEEKLQELAHRIKDAQDLSSDTEVKYRAALREIAQLRQDSEVRAKTSVSLADHTQVVASLGNAVKGLESEVDVLKQQLTQKTSQLDALQDRLAAEKDSVPEGCVSKAEHQQMRESLERKISQLTQLLQDALRKQDEMALQAAAAWQEVKDSKDDGEAARKLAAAREQENGVLSGKFREAQEAITQLKKQVENHVYSEREKNKKIDDQSKEVGKLKEALNSLSQLSYTTSSPKNRQQSQQVDSLQQQIKQLQYQLAESKKRHHEIVSVYRMHLLYAVQGQMDEDVQKALKQILVMCKIPAEDK